MKKGLKLFTTGIICMSALVWNVKADEVSTEADLETCLTKDTATCTVTEDFEITKSHKITTGKDIIFDLNGNKVIGPDDGKMNWYAFIVDGGKLTLKDTSEDKTGELWAKCYGIETKAGIFIMESGKITATNNQTLGAAIVNYGGKTEIKGGTLVAASNWAVNAQAYFADSELVITGGTFEVTSEVEAAVQVGGEYSVNKETVTISGGTFKGVNSFAVSSDTATVNITGGIFSTDVSDYMTINYNSIEVIDSETGDTKYVVATDDKIKNEPYEVGEVISSEKAEETLKEVEEKGNDEEKALVQEIRKALDGSNIISVHNILYGSFIGNDLINGENEKQPEEGQKVAVTLNIPTTLEKVKDGYTRNYSVVRIHYNVDTDKYEFDKLEAKDNEDGTITFETDRFSTYILAYDDIKDEVKTVENPKTLDGVSTYLILGMVSLMCISLISIFFKKEQKV